MPAVDRAVRARHEHERLQEHRHQDAGADAGGRYHGGVGQGREKASLAAVPGRKSDHRAVGRIVAGIADGVEQIEGNGDPHHFHQVVLRLRIVAAGGQEHQHDSDRHHRGRQEQVRACLAGGRTGVVDQLAHKQVARHDDDRGNDRQQHREDAELLIGQADDVRVVAGQVGAEDGVGHHRAKRRQKVSDEHFLQLDAGGGNARFQRGILKEFFHKCVPHK